jgi:hypothetical protein
MRRDHHICRRALPVPVLVLVLGIGLLAGARLFAASAIRPGARTMALDPKTHNIYLATADRVPAAGGSAGRPAVVPGSFRILVYGPAQEVSP